jgi:hypothetical protein
MSMSGAVLLVFNNAISGGATIATVLDIDRITSRKKSRLATTM